MTLPTADELMSDIDKTPPTASPAPEIAPKDPTMPLVSPEGENIGKPKELPTADELMTQVDTQQYEKGVLPAIGRIATNTLEAGKAALNSEDAALFTPQHRREAIDSGIPTMLYDPSALLYDTVFSPMAAGMAAYQAAAIESGRESGQPALGRDLALVPEAFPMGPTHGLIVHESPRMANEAASNYAARVPEEVYMGTVEPTSQQKQYAESAAAAVKPLPTVHEVAREVAPEVFTEYDRLKQHREELANLMRDESERNRQQTEASSPFAPQIAELQTRAELGSHRQQRIVLEKIEDLQEKHANWIQQNTGVSDTMEQLRAAYNKADYRMRDMSPDVSSAYRAAEQRIPKYEDVVPDRAEMAPEGTLRGKQDALAKEAVGARGKTQEVLARASKEKLEPEKLREDIKWAENNNRPDVIEALVGKIESGADKKAIDTHLPEGISGHVSQELVKAGRPLEEAQAAGKLIEEHYKTRSERFGGHRGTAEEMYARDSALIKSGRKQTAREFAQNKGRRLNQSSQYMEAAARFKQAISGDSLIRGSKDIVDRAARGKLTGMERRRLSNSGIDAVHDLEKAHDDAVQQTLFQSGEYGLPGFYSKMYRSFDEKLNAKGTPSQFLEQIEGMVKNGAFKKDELYWSGLEDHLKELPKDQKLTKEQVMKWLDENKLEINEHVLDTESDGGGFTEDDVNFRDEGRMDVESDDPLLFDGEVEHYVERFHEEHGTDAEEYWKKEGEPESDPFVDIEKNDDGTSEITWNDEAIRSNAEEQVRDYFSEYGPEVQTVNVGHGAHEYKIYSDEENGIWRIEDDNGREIDSGDGRPPRERANDALWEHLRENDIIRYSDDEAPEGNTVYSDYQSEGPKDDYRELLITLPQIRDKGVSQHGWPENAKDDNILLHTRFNSRLDKEGKKTLFIEEIQSDWQQQAREKGSLKKGELEAARDNFNFAQDEAEAALKRQALLGFDSIGEALRAVRGNEDWATRWDVEGTRDIDAIESYLEAAKNYSKAQDSVAEAPFNDLNKYSELAMKRLIGWAAENGFEKVAWTTGEQQAARWSGALQRHVEEIRISPDSTPEGIKIRVLRSGGSNVSDFIAKQAKDAKYDPETGYLTIPPDEIGRIFGKGLQDDIAARAKNLIDNPKKDVPSEAELDAAQSEFLKANNEYNRYPETEEASPEENTRLLEAREAAKQKVDEIKKARDTDDVMSGLDIKVSDKGMKEVYDKVLVNTANSIIKKFGAKVKASEIDTGILKMEVDRATLPTEETVKAKHEELKALKEKANISPDDFPGTNDKWNYHQEDQLHALDDFAERDLDFDKSIQLAAESKSRLSRVIRDIFDIKAEEKPAHTEQWSFDMTPELKKSAEGGQTLFQGALGKIRLATKSMKAVITLMRDANASTFIHETGHHWLDELLRDAEHPHAPQDLIQDAATVKSWLGASGEITTRQHERFARGFERYLMEGVAPSRELATVFSKFKNWLTDIYKNVQRLRSPINDDIRDVFDRMLSMKPEKSVVAPDNEAGRMMADIHEADAKSTPPEHAEAVADNMEREIDSTLNLHDPELHDAIKAAETGEGEAGLVPEEASGDAENSAGQPEPPSGQRDTVAAGGGESEGEGNGQPTGAAINRASTEPPNGANAKFDADGKFVDKAGNIRLDNLNTPEDVNEVLREAAADGGGFVDARRGVISDAQAEELADALGMSPAMLNTRKIGQAFSSEQIIAARKLLIQSATHVKDMMTKAAEGTDQDVMAYAEAKSRHMMIQEQVSGITAEAGRALRAFRSLEGSQETKLLGEFLKDATGKDLFQLKQEAQLGSKLETPKQISKFINDSKKSSFSDKAMEVWINALLSGPRTHMTNILSNMLVALYSIPESAVGAGVSKLLRSPERIALSEAKGRLFGLMQGAEEGAVTAWKALKDEKLMEESSKIEQHKFQAVGGKLGKAVRMPGRLLTAEDEFFKAVASRQELNALAYRQAAKEGLSGDPLAERVSDLMQNPTEDMLKQADAAAKYQTFTKDLGPTGKAIQKFANSHPAIKFIIPFIRTPTNILKYAGERTPLGAFSAEVRKNLSGKNGSIARDQQIARMALGTTIGLATIGQAIKGNVTGGGPTDPRKMALLRATGWQPYSVKIGNMYYGYNRFEPFGTILGVSADMVDISEGAKDADIKKMSAMLLAAISKNLTSKTWLQGPSDLIQAISDPDRYGEGYVKRFAGTAIPSIVAQSAQSMDPIMREANTIIDGIKSRIPGLSETLYPKRDIWGDPIIREGGLGPDILSPVSESTQKKDPISEQLLQLGVFPAKVERKIGGVTLTDKQYDDYARIAGKMTKVMLTNLMQPGFSAMPQEAQIKMVRTTIEQARETARNMVKFNPANRNIMQTMIQNKQALFKR